MWTDDNGKARKDIQKWMKLTSRMLSHYHRGTDACGPLKSENDTMWGAIHSLEVARKRLAELSEMLTVLSADGWWDGPKD